MCFPRLLQTQKMSRIASGATRVRTASPDRHSADVGVKFKLLYFDIKARGEAIRLMFHAAGVPFDDVRVENNSSWDKMKTGIFSLFFSTSKLKLVIYFQRNRSVCQMRTGTCNLHIFQLPRFVCVEMPYQTLPVLVFDGGRKLGQTMSIARYLALEFGAFRFNFSCVTLTAAVFFLFLRAYFL